MALNEAQWPQYAHRRTASAFSPHSLRPFPRNNLSQAELLTELVQSALADEPDLVNFYREPGEGQKPQMIGQGYEISRPQEAQVAGKLVEWTERVLVIYSPSLAGRAYRGLQGRLERAQEKL